MLHSKKSESILQWFNSLTTKGDVNSIEQFTDGSHFYDIVVSMQPFLLQGKKKSHLSGEPVIFSETSIACNEEVITSVEKETAEGSKETSVSESANADPFVIKESDHIDTQKKYDDVRKFIDDFYHIDSFLLIDYGECQKGKELELAKVAIFLLSAMVQNLLSTEDKLVYNITLLENEIQENIQECLSLLIEKDREENQIKKSELHKILNRGANCKGTQLRNQRSRSQELNDSLEGAKHVSRKRKERTTVYEYPLDSPLKNLLESPKVQNQVALIKKNSELAKLRSALYNEENKVNDLTEEKQNLKYELGKKNKELEFYKKDLASLREALGEKEEQENLRTEELKNKKIEDDRIRKSLQCQEEEIEQLKKENIALQEKASDIEKKLEHRAATSLKGNESLKNEIDKLIAENQIKDVQMKALTDNIASLEKEKTSLKDKIHSLQVPKSAVSTIHYVQCEETSERKEEAQKNIIKLSKDQSKNSNEVGTSKSENVESLQEKVKAFSENESKLKEEIKTLNEKLQEYESTFVSIPDEISGTRTLNSIKNESDMIGSTTDSKAEIQFLKKTIQAIIRKLEKSNFLQTGTIKQLREICHKITDFHGVAACLRDIFEALKSVDKPAESLDQPSITTRSRLAAEELNANKALKNDLIKLNKQVAELSKANQDLEDLNQKLTAEVKNSQQEVANAKEKYINMEKLAKKKDDDVKRALIMYQRIVKLDKKDKESKKECSEECEKLRKRCKKLNEECLDFEQESAEFKRSIKNLEGMMEHLQFEIKELKTKNKELQQKLWEETSALSKNTTDRDALVFHYLKKSKHEPKKSKNLDLKKEEQKKFSRPIVKVDAYILNSDNEPSMSNSMLASRSIRSSYFQVADEDDFLNESSLAEIHNMGIPGGESGDHRLLEIQRRNTLCPPHLQSSYPLEIQNMTPSERKYYNPEDVSYDMGRKSSMYHGKRDIHRKLKSKYMESDSSDSDESHTLPVKRLKVAETDHISLPASTKKFQASYGVTKRTSKDQGNQRKASTPLKQVATYVKKRSMFKTPLAVHRLMASSKNKIH